MELHQAVDELQKNLEEIKKQHRLKRLRTVLKFLLIGFLIGRNVERKISELTKRNKLMTNSLLKRFKDFEHTIKGKVEGILNSGTYLIYSDKQNLIETIESFEASLNYCGQSDILDIKHIDKWRKKIEKSRQTVLDYNKYFIQQRKKDYSYLWNKGLLSLDEEQQVAIVTDDKHNLVVAAAGSGKTEVLITRIAYLIARKPDGVPAERILAIAFQRKAMEEIEQRLSARYNISNVNVKTFHKLGKDILEQTGKEFRHTDIVNENKKHEIIQKIFKQKIKNEPDYYRLFLNFVKTLHDKETKEDVEIQEETLRYARERTYFSIDKQRVNSQAEKEILDFFLTNKLNGKSIEVTYEPDIEGFRPDFYLPEYDLYIEHWALNEKGEVPDWFRQSTEEYRKTMEMKKRWFVQHDKPLIETFAYEYEESDPDKFIELLKKRVINKLRMRHDCEFEFTYKTYDEVVEIAWRSYRTPVDDIVNFITSAKTYGLKPEEIKNRLRNMIWTPKQLAFGNLVLPIYYVYEGGVLQKHEKIDFEDMINVAIEELDENPSLRADVYDHILIDEYQDISAQRYKLIKKLMERNPKCKLFCVGDDWQSIMGFSGSNLNFFVNFEQYFENPAITKISTNYRSVKTIVDAGADLIRNNTSCQIQKPTMSNCKDVKPIKVIKLLHREEYERNYHRQMAEDCLNRISDLIQNGYSPRDILVLSRCMRTRIGRGYRFLFNVGTFIEKAKENDIRLAYDNREARNKVRLLTAHKSKGLEAKVVFLLNVTKGMYGFPCEIEDSSIYEPAREDYPPQDTKEEERRLFYVAMTRAMEDLFIYTWKPAVSEFLEEIAAHTTEEELGYW